MKLKINLFDRLMMWVHSFFIGTKAVNDEIFTQNGIDTSSSTNIQQRVQDNRVSLDLLAGKVTQQVEELRYRTYRVDREAKEYNYFTPLLAVKREKRDSKSVIYENSENLPIITIQNNFPMVENLNEGFEQLGSHGKHTMYWIDVERKGGFFPRYKIEEYTKRLVVRELEQKKRAMLDFYISIYPNENDYKSKGFIREVERIKETGSRSDITSLKRVSFVTSNAYKYMDMFKFEFKHLKYVKTAEFDGYFVISFESDITKYGEDMLNRYLSKTMEQKYANKEKKDTEITITGHELDKVYNCDICGREIRYSPDDIDNMDVTGPDSLAKTNNTEYFDIQITKETYGKYICNKCLEKYLNEISELISEEKSK